MLGLARASEYAGWWNQNGPLILRDTVTVTSRQLQPFVVTPRYYADFNGSGSNSTSFVYSTTQAAFDTTGVVNQPKRSVIALTFQVGTDWMVSAPTTGFYTGAAPYVVMGNNGTEVYYSSQLNKSSNFYQITTNGFQGLNLTPAQLSPYRNRWLAAIVSTSDSTSDFADWSGTGANTYNWCSRVVLYDIAADTVVASADTYANSAVGTVDLTQTWTMGYASSSYYVNPFTNFDNITLYDRDQYLESSRWFTIGQTLDPGVYYRQLAGNSIGSTVGGVQAWINASSDSVGTVILDGNLDDYGYDVDIGTWGGARQPSDSIWQIHGTYNGAPPLPPVFVSF